MAHSKSTVATASLALAGHLGACPLAGIAATEAGGAGSSANGRAPRRQLAVPSGCAVFLSTALGNVSFTARLSARRRSHPSLACACARPHPALVSSPNRAASPQISLRSEFSIPASPNSPTIANGLRKAKSGSPRSQHAARFCGEKICPDLRHLCGTRFLLLSVRGAIDN